MAERSLDLHSSKDGEETSVVILRPMIVLCISPGERTTATSGSWTWRPTPENDPVWVDALRACVGMLVRGLERLGDLLHDGHRLVG